VLSQDIQKEAMKLFSFQIGRGPYLVVEDEGIDHELTDIGNVNFSEFVASVRQVFVELSFHWWSNKNYHQLCLAGINRESS
jgi:hypothetical protein